jgi:hypothetical protein
MNDHDRTVERLRNALAGEQFTVPVQTIAQHAEQSRFDEVPRRYRAISMGLAVTDALCIVAALMIS